MCRQMQILTDDEKYANKCKFTTLLTKLDIDITPIFEFLDSINYFEAPFNAQTCRSVSGGLCSYALDLFNELYQLCNAYYPNKYTEKDIIKVALFKDVYRAVLYEPYSKNVKNDLTNQWETVSAYKTRESRPVFGDIGFSSYMLTRKLIDYSDEQIEAICNADASTYVNDIHEIRKQFPLVILTNMATMAAGYID